MRLLLRPGEHDDALRERSAHQRQQVRFFVRRRPRAEPQHLLGERPGGRADLVRGEPRGVLHGELREVLHAAGERRAEQQRLPPPRAVAHDLADLLQEPHLQKPVRLVQHQRREVLQPDAVRVPHVVDEPPGRCDDNLGARAQRRRLDVRAQPPDHQRGADGRELRQPLRHRVHLHGEFANGHEHEHVRRRHRVSAAVQHALQ
mmetsp:Transcript_9062/g.38096  ORF Transcript_9062/g.38096 Transcript_9062/m.38096 type:complete len:203 (+) Transcript_9062:1541-2149(+)